MFQPVGPQPPSVYWRRRFVILVALVLLLLLLILVVRAITSGASGKPTAADSTRSAGRHSNRQGNPGLAADSGSRRTPSPAAPRRNPRGHGSQSGSQSGPPASASTSSSVAPPPRCLPSQLAVQAAVGQSTYQVGQQPVVMLQVTNIGSAPCVQDLADRQVVLKVYNGESRVWGSHDCQVKPGVDDRVLDVGHPVRVSILWSGLTSQPGCGGTRRRVGAGSYTLYGSLSGEQGKAAQFSIV